MPSRTRRQVTFIVPGQDSTPGSTTVRGRGGAPLPAGLTHGRLRASVDASVGRGPAAGNGQVRVSATPGEDVVVLRIAGGPELVLHPDTARDLMLAQSGLERTGSTRGASSQTGRSQDDVVVPARLQWRGLEQVASVRGRTRGWLGDVLMSGVDIITDLSVDAAAGAAARAIAARVDGHVAPGVYALSPDVLSPLKGGGLPGGHVPPQRNSDPLLMLLHGTFSDTAGTFSRLWTHHPHLVRALFKRYGGRVFALDHPTLGHSPIANALMLAETLPSHARLHLVAHARGGLVAEVLARCSSGPDDGIESFAGSDQRSDLGDLRRLVALMTQKDIRIERIVRVACPARGTLLASKRLDAYLSVFRWTLELAGIPIAPTFVDFLAAVAKQRADPLVFPGLAAQMPDSPLIRWLHAARSPIAGQLRVVSGDVEGDSVTSWLKTLLTDAFYWTDHDLVVQTRSMYGGARRRDGASFLFDQGAQVSHFNYFSNERTAQAIVNALVDDRPHGFRPIGPLSWAGESSTGTRAATAVVNPGDTDAEPHSKPAVILLGGSTGPLAAFLSKTHEVITFPFDWLQAIEVEARRLAPVVAAALDARATTDQPVRIMAHSSAGLVVRALQWERPAVWKRLLAHKDSRILLLGPPNGGSWTPMQVLSGDDAFEQTMAAIDAPFDGGARRQQLANRIGLLQQQAGLVDRKSGLARRDTWAQLAREDLERMGRQAWWHSTSLQLDDYRWGVPSQATLDRAVTLRRRLDGQRNGALAAFARQFHIVLGVARSTPDGFDSGTDGFQYLNALDAGDGRVTDERALLPGVRTWVLDADHGELPRRADAFAAYLDLLRTGTTSRLAAFGPKRERVAGATPHVRSRPGRARPFGQPPDRLDPFAVDRAAEPESSVSTGAALRVTVVNGDLSFEARPLLIGHYRSIRLTGTEWVMNRLVGGSMEDALGAGLYPDGSGTHLIFVNQKVDPNNPWRLPRPEAVIVAGLGDEGAIRSADLVHTVRQAVLAWAQRLAERPTGAAPVFELAATLIGSGGTGVTAGQSAQLIAQGVREANRSLDDRRANERRWPRVSHLHLIELYLDRAAEAWRALRMQALAAPGEYLVGEAVEIGTGPLPRPIDSGYRGADYDLITATTEQGEDGGTSIAYTLDTRRARTEVRAQATQTTLLRELLAKASNDRNRDSQIGRTLFQLLVPIEMEPFLGGTTEMVIELDGGTAGIPWELLDTTTGAGRDQRPWAIRTKLLRKLRTTQFRAQVVDADPDASVLVVGEPACGADYPRLAGARAEARGVAERLTASGALAPDKVTALISPDDPDETGADARTILNALLERDWRIVHVAGHGEPPQPNDPRGVVLSNQSYLGPREIRNMRAVPELVFVNCCHLAARSPAQTLAEPHDRARFAAGVAEELIRIGVRCVIAAGWAVEDAPACAFATAFYEALLAGRRFIDAVAEAREAAASYGGNTWAAYQCYGDPDWTFRLGVGDAQRPREPLADEFGGVASPTGLAMALETLAVRSRFQGADPEEQQAKLRHLESRFATRWGALGRIAEAFGAAWSDAGRPAEAEAWYARAIAANDGSASIKATEQLGNIRARMAWASAELVARRRDGRARRTALTGARHQIAGAIALLEGLASLQPSMERHTLCGSAYKRLAFIESSAGRPREERAAIEAMRQHYQRAEALGRDSGLRGFFYPALNRIAAELVLGAGRPGWRGLDERDIVSTRQGLAHALRDDPDFWSMAGQTELSMYEAIAGGTLAESRVSIEDAYKDLHTRVGAPWMWASVHDQARFVLGPYLTRAKQPDARAARALLTLLETYSGVATESISKSKT